MNNPTEDGATPVVEDEATAHECMGRWAHRWQWVWEQGVWLDRCRCTTCGEEREMMT